MGTLTIGEMIAQCFLGSLIGLAVVWTVINRSDITDLKRRIKDLERRIDLLEKGESNK